MEEWIKLKWNDQYEISNHGMIKSNTLIGKGRILRQYETIHGYLTVKITIDGKRKTLAVHRLVAKSFLENPNNLPQVNHKDGNKKNNKLDNLEWCSGSENIRHAVEIGLRKQNYFTYVMGKNPSRKLEKSEVLEIREFFKNGVTKKELLMKYPVKKRQLNYILTNASWKNLI